MPVYQYRGLDASSRKASGLIDADSPKAAVQKLKKLSIFPINISETGERKKETRFRIPGLGERVNPLELAVMTRQLSTLAGAGLPLVQCLSALTEQVSHPRLKKVLAEVKDLVNEGAAFADALGRYPRIFSDFYVNMVRAGESSGALELVLERLADFTESQSQLRNQVLFAMLYPAAILLIGLTVMVAMFTVVIPRISVLFEQTKMTLPLITRLMMVVSSLLRKFIWLIAPAIAAAFYGVQRWRKSAAGRETWDTYALKVPFFGELVRKLAVARFAKTLSTLLKSGIPLLKGLEIVEKVVNNTVIAKAIAQAKENITEGASIAGPLRASGVFPPFVIQMIASGEQSGELEFLLEKAAVAFDREVETAVTGIVKLIEPVMILFMAALVALIIVSFLLPIIQLTQGIG